MYIQFPVYLIVDYVIRHSISNEVFLTRIRIVHTTYTRQSGSRSEKNMKINNSFY